ncbi:MAG TPA: hypothetical protein VN633_22295 [Bryobacteraceae bacterium]|nr:hypothetical protein [Bryobacteraceae bacterium]
MTDSDPHSWPADEPWPDNYFNYFTEIEEHFQKARGTSLFLLSPLDWALIENWKNSGVPLEAVVQGIDEAFEKWRGRKVKSRQVNSLAYCTQAVMEAAKRLTGAGAIRARQTREPLFAATEVRDFLTNAAAAISATGNSAFQPIESAVETLAAEAETHLTDLEDLERRLTSLEEKMVAIARAALSDDNALAMRRQLDNELAPYRSKMTAEQIAMLERRYLDTRIMERIGLPRLSLFYMR